MTCMWCKYYDSFVSVEIPINLRIKLLDFVFWAKVNVNSEDKNTKIYEDC